MVAAIPWQNTGLAYVMTTETVAGIALSLGLRPRRHEAAAPAAPTGCAMGAPAAKVAAASPAALP